MSEQMDLKSLTSLATKSGLSARGEQSESDYKARASAAQRSGGFDGFLKTFLGNDKAGASGKTSGKSATRQSTGNSGGKAADPDTWTGPETKKSDKNAKTNKSETGKMSRQERRALREAMDKTVPEGELAAIEPVNGVPTASEILLPPEVAEAAAEAARLIFGLMYPDAAGEAGTGAGMDMGMGEGFDLSALPGQMGETEGEGGEALSRLAEILNRLGGNPEAGEGDLAGLGANAGIDSEMLLAALDTSNASAEMNIDAVLSALEELLDGMPRQALEQALAETAESMGLAAEGGKDAWFAEIAAALDAEVTDMNTPPDPGTNNRLLAELEAAALRAESAPVARDADAEAALDEIIDETIDTDPPETIETAEMVETVGAMETETAEVAAETLETAEASETTEITAAVEAGETADLTAVPAKTGSEAAPARTGQDSAVEEMTAEIAADKVSGTEKAEEAEESETPEFAKVAEEGEKVAAENSDNAAATIERQKTAEISAENAGVKSAETEIYGLFKQFLKEKIQENNSGSPINNMESLDAEDVGELLDVFADWVAGATNSKEAKALTADAGKLANALANAFAQESATAETAVDGEGEEVFSWLEKNLESMLQKAGGKNSAATAPGTQGQPQGQMLNDAKLFGQVPMGETTQDQTGQNPGQTAVPMAATSATQAAQAVQNAPTSMSSMMEQIENIERVAEAMKMANRNGVKNLTLQLSPPELGKMTLTVESRAGIVSAILRVEKPEAVAQLGQNLQQLRENLKAQGIELGELEVRQQSQGQAMGDGEKRKRNNETDADENVRARRPGRLGDDGEEEDIAIDTRGTGNGRGGLNLFA